MKKIQRTSFSVVENSIEKMKEIFPEAFIEGKLDFEILKQLLGEYIEGDKERYSFTWKGKTKARKMAQDMTNTTLRPEQSVPHTHTHNIYIEGENLEVLKLLQKSYHSKIKMIYIDPPYNTGNDFIYKDNFRNNLQNYFEITGQSGKDGQKLSTDSDSSGRYHSDWLNMMYPRLKLARNLLIDDGVIFISIDDNELTNLKKICDEIFGEDNFIELFLWNKGQGSSLSRFTRSDYEYILCYGKSKNRIMYKFKAKKTDEMQDSSLLNNSNRYSELIFPAKTINFVKNKSGVIKSFKENDLELINDIFIENYFNKNEVRIKAKFKWSQKYLDDNLNKGTTIISKTDNLRLRYIKKKEEDIIVPTKSITEKNEVGFNLSASSELKKLLGKDIFSYPKPVSLLKYIIDMVCDRNDIILDFFSGSATTAHAVMQLNAEDGGERKYIMIQVPELCDEKSEAYKAGYRNICEIGKERIRKAGIKIREDESLLIENRKKLDIDFKVFRLDSSNIKEWDNETKNLKQSLFEIQESIKEDRTELDLIYEIILKYGLELDEKIEKKGEIYLIKSGRLLINLDKNLDMKMVNQMCEECKRLMDREEEKKISVILRDSSFKNDTDKTNIIKKFEQMGIKEIKTI